MQNRSFTPIERPTTLPPLVREAIKAGEVYTDSKELDRREGEKLKVLQSLFDPESDISIGSIRSYITDLTLSAYGLTSTRGKMEGDPSGLSEEILTYLVGKGVLTEHPTLPNSLQNSLSKIEEAAKTPEEIVRLKALLMKKLNAEAIAENLAEAAKRIPGVNLDLKEIKEKEMQKPDNDTHAAQIKLRAQIVKKIDLSEDFPERKEELFTEVNQRLERLKSS